MLQTLRAFFGGSKKATLVLVGLLTVLLRDVLGLEPASVSLVVQLVMSYIVGQGAVDVALALRGQKTR